MNLNSPPDPQWDKLSVALREAGLATRPADEDLSAPHGFAGQVVSRFQADSRADATGLHLWRRWSLAGAATALLLCGGAFLVPTAEVPAPPIIPIPSLEPQPPQLSNR